MKIKSEQLQIRVTAEQKAAIKRAAALEGQDVSSWVLKKILGEKRERFQELLQELPKNSQPKFILAEINDFLFKLTKKEFTESLTPPLTELSIEMANRIAAMIEVAASKKGAQLPNWINDIKPSKYPIFDSDLLSLRLYLLSSSPPAFRKRNIFVDSTIGDRI